VGVFFFLRKRKDIAFLFIELDNTPRVAAGNHIDNFVMDMYILSSGML
jgi:hypothetical protein